MPLLENVQVALMEVLEVRGKPLKEDELWGLLCQGVEAIQDLLLTGKACKDGMLQNLVTPQTLLCTSRGRIMLGPCSYDNIKGTIFCPPDIFVNDNSAEIEIEKIYVYTFGQTLNFSSTFVSEENGNEPVRMPRLSPLLTTVIKAMCQIDVDLRMGLADILQICSEHAARFTKGVPFSFFVVRFHQEVMGSLPETEILSQVEKEISRENEKSKNASKAEELIESDFSDEDFSDKNHLYGHRIAFIPASKRKKSKVTEIVPKEDVSPREKWKTAIEKVKVQNRRKKMWLHEIEEVQEGWKSHKAQKSIQKVYEELVERRKMLELLRLSINIGPSLPVDTDLALTKGMKPKTLADLVLLLHQPPKGTTSKSNSIDHGDMLNNNPDGASISRVMSFSDSSVPHLVRMSSKDSGRHPSSPHHGSLRRKHLSAATKMNHPYYSMECIDYSKLAKLSGKRGKPRQFVGPEFILSSLKPNVLLDISSTAKENLPEQSNMPSPRHITVVMLNGQRLDVTCSSLIRGRQLFHSVAQHFMLPEHYLFGLAILKDGEFLFVDAHQRLSKVAPSGWAAVSLSSEARLDMPPESFTMYLRFKFYVDDINLIRHQIVRHMFYLQLRKDILEERTWCESSTAITLAGFALQAEFGDYSKEIYSKNYFLVDHYLPQRILKQFSREEAKGKIHESHCFKAGLSEEMAELEFIQEVQKLPEYGHHFHKTYQNKRDPYSGVWLTICASGIKVFEKKGDDRRMCQQYLWNEIWRISFTRRYFCLMPKTESLMGRHVKYKFYTSEPLKGRYLFHMAMSHHKFFSKLKLKVKVSEIFMEDFELDGGFSCDEASVDTMDEDESDLPGVSSDPSTKLPWKQLHSQQQRLSASSNYKNSSGYKRKPKLLGNRVKELASNVPKKIREHLHQLREFSSQESIGSNPDTSPTHFHMFGPKTGNLSIDRSDVSSSSGDSIVSHPDSKCGLDTKEPPVIEVHLVKDEAMGLGLLLTCADNVIDGSYVESMIEGGPAYNSGTLSPGDQIISVNGLWVENWSYLDVVDLIKKSPSEVKLKVAKKSLYAVRPFLCQSEKDIFIQNDYKEISPIGSTKQIDVEYPNSPINNNNNGKFLPDVDPNLNVIKTNGKSLTRRTEPPPVPKRKKRNELVKLKERKYQVSESACDKILEDEALNNVQPSINESLIISDVLVNDSTSANSYSEISEVILNGCDRLNVNNEISVGNGDQVSSHQIHPNNFPSSSVEGVFHVTLQKVQNSLGLRIMSGDNYFPESEGVYVQSLIEGGVADKDGRIKPGDRILEINGICLDGMDYSEVVKTIRELPTEAHLVLHRGLTHPCVIELEEPEEPQLSYTVPVSNSENHSSHLETNSSDPSKIAEDTMQCSSDRNDQRQLNSSKCDPDSKAVPPPVPPRRISGAQKTRPKSVFALTEPMSHVSNQRTIKERPKSSIDAIRDAIQPISSVLDNITASCAKPKLDIPVIHCGICSSAKIKTLPSVHSEPQCNSDHSSRPHTQGLNFDSMRALDHNCSSSHIPNQESNNTSGLHRVPEQNEKNIVESANENSVNSKPKGKLKDMTDVWNYMTPENTFEVSLTKSSRGLGLCVYGGYNPSNTDPALQLIRIRKLYPLQAANECGKLQIGDVIVAVNGKCMIGLTHSEGLETLRMTPADVVLKIFRPDSSLIPPLTLYISLDSPSGSILLASPSTSASNTLTKKDVPIVFPSLSKEFEVTLVKREGSLGFTIARRDYQEGSPPPGLYIKSLVREPAVSDGRIQPGDQIIQVNGVDVSDLSHAEAITFLRNTPVSVTLRLHRHPEELMSPLSLDEKPHVVKPLRKEAMILLSDKRDSPKRRRERRRKSGSSTGSSSNISSSSGDSVSSGKDSNVSTADSEKSADLGDHLDKGLLQRNLRPRSLDILGTSQKRNELSALHHKDDDSGLFYRQASVTGAMLSYDGNKKATNDGKRVEKEMSNAGLKKWRGRHLLENEEDEKNTFEELNDFVDKGSSDRDVASEVEKLHRQFREDLSKLEAGTEEKHPVERTFPVEMDRGWHGRLGFGICDEFKDLEVENVLDLTGPFVKAVYPGSLAEADGRIRAGDRLLQVNGEDVCGKPAREVIDILRKTRGKIRMLFSRIE